MAIDALNTWQNEWANLPRVNDDSWKTNLANYIEARVLGLKLQTYTPNSNISFSFNKSIFINNLSGIDNGLGNGAVVIGTAFKSAIESSALSLITPISIETASPSTTFSSVTSAIFDTASTLLASSKIAELVNAASVSNALDSEYPVKLRDAVLLLTVTVAGIDSTTPTPLPLIDAARAVN